MRGNSKESAMTHTFTRSAAGTATGSQNAETYFTEHEAAELLRLSRRTLQRWRQKGLGLPFRRFGGLVRYARSDIDAWAAKQSRLSTSEVA
jgi:excisionase family DNA binding protein